MSKDKQIEEMGNAIYLASPLPAMWREDALIISEKLHKAGYRKASEVVEEIFEKLKVDLKGYIGLNYLDELKKKYEEEGK